nr:HEPN domain-containing protein [Bosea sp. 117]
MYVELRRFRGLGRRGQLPPGNDDLLWLPRSAVVAAISSLDAYVHAAILERLPHVLRASPVPSALCAAMADILPIKNSDGFREALPVIISPSGEIELTKRLNEKVLAFSSYQAPEKVQGAYAIIGHSNVFDAVAATWPGPNSSADDLKRLLANYVKRRNQIAHEGDREATGSVRPMQPSYANNCTAFIENLVTRLNRIVYGV